MFNMVAELNKTCEHKTSKDNIIRRATCKCMPYSIRLITFFLLHLFLTLFSLLFKNLCGIKQLNLHLVVSFLLEMLLSLYFVDMFVLCPQSSLHQILSNFPWEEHTLLIGNTFFFASQTIDCDLLRCLARQKLWIQHFKERVKECIL